MRFLYLCTIVLVLCSCATGQINFDNIASVR